MTGRGSANEHIHFCDTDGVKFKRRSLEALGSLIVGNVGRDDAQSEEEARYFPYRSSSYITEFFQELDTEYQHDGSTRHRWVADVLELMLAEPHEGPTRPPDIFCRLIDQLMSPSDRFNEGPDRPHALAQLNEILTREGFEAFYGEDGHCYLRHTETQTIAVLEANPHRPLSRAEQERRQLLAAYLDHCSEDNLIEEVLLPLFRQLGYHRVTAAGHRDKALEYGNWLGNALDATKRSQIMFMDRDDILNLYVVTSLPLPEGARPSLPQDPWSAGDEAPF